MSTAVLMWSNYFFKFPLSRHTHTHTEHWWLPQLRWFALNVLPMMPQDVNGQLAVDPGGIIHRAQLHEK